MADTLAAAYACLPVLPGQDIDTWKAVECDVEKGLEASDASWSGDADEVEVKDAAVRPAAAWHAQVVVLSLRMMRNWWRNPKMLTAREELCGEQRRSLSCDCNASLQRLDG